MAARPLHPRVRAAAWLVTGPLGHLWGGAADTVAILLATLGRRVRERVRPGAPSLPGPPRD